MPQLRTRPRLRRNLRSHRRQPATEARWLALEGLEPRTLLSGNLQVIIGSTATQAGLAGFVDVTLNVPQGITTSIAGYNVATLVAPGAAGVTLTTASAGDDPLFVGQTPLTFNIGNPAGFGVGDDLSGSGNAAPAVTGKDLFRLHFTVAAGTQGTFAINSDPIFFILSDGQGNAVPNVDVIAGAITVSIPQPPTVNDAALSVPENSANNTEIGFVTATDPNAGDSVTFAIIAGNGSGAFAIDSATGRLTVANGSLLNFESQPSFNLTIRGTDITGRTDDAAITVNLSNVNEAPTDIALSAATVAENAAGAVIGTLTVTDPDAGDTHAFVVSDNRFEVAGGQLKLKAGVSLDFETEPQVNLTVTATDQAGAGFAINKPFAITVIDVPESTFGSIDEVQISSLEGNPGQDRKLTLTLRLNAALTSDVVMHVSTAGGSALAGTDFVEVDMDVTFLPGQTVKVVEIPIIEDLIDEPDENLFISLVGISANVTASDQVEAVILDDETQAIVLSQQQVTVPEDGSTIVTVGLLFESSFDVTVSLVKEAGGDVDLTANPLQFLFTPGNSTATQNLTVSAASDADTAAGTAVFTLSGVNLASVQLNATEGDDETQVSLALLDAAAAETNVGQAANPGVFRITRTGSTQSALTVEFSLAGTAGNGIDYTTLPLSAVIPAGATFVDVTVAPINDAISEISETVILTITPSAAYGITGADNATMTIADNDPVLVSIAALDAVLTEGTPATDTGTIRISRTGATTSLLNVNITKGGVATFGSTPTLGDYNLAGGINAAGTVVTIPAGAAFVDITATPRDDTTPEPTESLTMTLAAGVGYALPTIVAERTVTLNLADNEPQVRIETLDAAAAESGSPAGNTATFRIHRTQSTAGPLTVNFTVGTTPAPVATRTTDYVLQKNNVTFTTNTVVIDAGQAFVDVVVVPVDDALAEVTENVTLNLAAGTTYTLDPDAADRTGTATIADNEPIVSIAAIDNTAAESGTPGTEIATFRISRTTNTGNLTVNLTRTGTATFSSLATGGDYGLTGGINAAGTSVVIPDGASFVDVTLTPREDALNELTESATLTLAALTTYTLDPVVANRSATANILDNEVRTLSINDITVTEGNAGTVNAIFTVTLSSAMSQTVTVDVATADGTATAGTDYVALPLTTLTFAPGQVSKTVTVLVNGDVIDEDNQTFNVNLSNAVNATVVAGADGIGVGTITDNDAAPTIRIADATVNETDAGTVNAAFNLTLSAPSEKTITVRAATGAAAGVANTLATSGVDFTALPATTFTFTPGQTSQPVNVTVLSDNLAENNEKFAVNLTLPTNATIADAQGIGTINDDDQPTISINDVTVTEPNLTAPTTINATFNVTLSHASTVPVTVKFATAPNTATATTDYTTLALTTLTFNPGETSKNVNVVVKGDVLDEIDETFFVNLSAATAATIADAQGVGTITDNDATPTLSVADVSIIEGDSGVKNLVFTVKLSAASGQTVSVDVATADGTATGGTAGVNGADYTSVATTNLIFTPGQTSKTVNVAIAGDLTPENSETILFNLTNAVNATIADAQGVGTITSDEFAPATIAGLTMNAVIATGTGGATPTGTFQVIFAPVGGTYSVIGDGVNTDDASGTFTYTKTGKNTGRINFIDSVDGPGVITLTFTSVTTATYVLTQGAARQTGTMTVV